MYLIMGKSKAGTEEIDEFDTRKEALKMLAEYRVAYGAGWTMWIKRKKVVN